MHFVANNSLSKVTTDKYLVLNKLVAIFGKFGMKNVAFGYCGCILCNKRTLLPLKTYATNLSSAGNINQDYCCAVSNVLL